MESKNKYYNRRRFLSRTFSGMASVGLLGGSGKALSIDRQEFTPDSDKKIIYRTLGKTGIRLPVVSMGVNAPEAALVKAAFKTGMRYFSTARRYHGGLCEKAIGDAIRELGVRDQVVIATKIRNGTRTEHPYDLFLERFLDSLERLQTDYVDILYLYNINRVEQILNSQLQEALTHLKQQNKIRFCGFSTHSGRRIELLNKAAEIGFYDVIVVSFNYTMADDASLIKAMENASQKGIGLVVMKTQCGGEWGVADGYRKPKEKPKNQTAMLKWVLRHQFITTAIPGLTAFDHITENFSVAFDLEYTPEEKRFFRDENVRYSLGFCQQCEKCVETCPRGVDIPTLMRMHMYAHQYHNTNLVHLALQDMDPKKGLSHCRNCQECRATCFHSVPISKNIAALKMLNFDKYC